MSDFSKLTYAVSAVVQGEDDKGGCHLSRVWHDPAVRQEPSSSYVAWGRRIAPIGARSGPRSHSIDRCSNPYGLVAPSRRTGRATGPPATLSQPSAAYQRPATRRITRPGRLKEPSDGRTGRNRWRAGHRRRVCIRNTYPHGVNFESVRRWRCQERRRGRDYSGR